MNFHFNISKHGFLLIGMAIVNCLLLFSCGEDRTYEYEEATKHSIWMYNQMADYYYFNEKLKQPEEKDYFSKPIAFFEKLTAQSDDDKWSYIVVDTLRKDPRQRGKFNHLNSYGIDYVLMQDPTGATTRNVLRVMNVIEGSPADNAGLMRNDFIDSFDNNYKFTTKNEDRLVSGIGITLNVVRLSANVETQEYQWTDEHKIEVSASRYVEDKAVALSNIIQYKDKKVGYVMFNRLTETNSEVASPTADYKKDMDNAFAQFKSNNVDELVLDFRNCNDGTFEMARRLSSYVVSPSVLTETFLTRTFNTNHPDRDDAVTFDQSLSGSTLSMKRVFVITSSYTQGAAEWVILALRNVLGAENVILVGTETAGQGFYTENIANEDNIVHLFPVVALIEDKDYNNVISYTPDVTVDEKTTFNLLPYGSIYEAVLAACLSKMVE